MTFGERITTTTQDKLLPKVCDTILNSNVLAQRILSQPKKWSGENLKVPVKIAKNSNGGSFDGFDTFEPSASNTRRNLQFDPRFYRHTVSLPLTDISVNMTAERVIDLVALELESTAEDMADSVGDLFYADGTGNENKNFLGLGALVDDGTNVATIGGLSRSTWATLASTLTASGGTLTLAKMATLYNAVTSGSQKPTIAMATEAVFSFYEELLEPRNIINNVPLKKGEGLTGQAGFTSIMYKGVPVTMDEKQTSGRLDFLNEDYLSWHGLPVAMTESIKYAPDLIEGNDYGSIIRNLGFSWSGWIKPSNSAAIVGHIFLGGNFITKNPKRHGALTGITGV